MKTRRDFLKTLAAALPALACSSGVYATPGNDARFLLVFLRGGYDAANLLVPHSSSFYYESRPNIAIARPNPALDIAALPVDADWGLHPALRDSLWPLFQRREVAFIPFAGTANTSRSHFETQDSIELGQPLEGRRDFNSGFLNRLVEVLGGRPAIAFTDNLPVVFKGAATIPNTTLKNAGKAPFDERQSALLAGMYRNHPLEDFVREGLDMRREMAREFDQEMKEASRNAVSAKGFEVEARRMARLMRDKFDIGFVDVGGWDSHINQGGAQGMLANNLDNLGRGLAVFAAEMQPIWGKTVVLVISEFGRTFRENGNRGTDHGHGTTYWVLGGAINGGRVIGEQVRVERNTLFQDRDFPVLNDYRSVLGGLFERLFAVSPKDLQKVFPTLRSSLSGIL